MTTKKIHVGTVNEFPSYQWKDLLEADNLNFIRIVGTQANIDRGKSCNQGKLEAVFDDHFYRNTSE